MRKVIIIAEAGVNHNGDIKLAKKLVDVAVDSGADFVKFQTFKSENVVSKSAKKASYQIKNTKNSSENQFQMLKKLELSFEQHQDLILYCKEKKIKFFATHDSNFAEKYCNKIFIMKKGTLKVYNNVKEGLDYFRNNYYKDN